MTISHPPTPGTALWVHTHPRKGSLNERIFQEGVASLAENRTVLTSDLYEQGFDPALRASDVGRFAGIPGNLAEQLGDAYEEQQLPEDIRAEQRKIAEAELLIFQFPLWWYGMPAMLKGWFDRVFTAGFAHGDLSPDGMPLRYGEGGLAGRKALIIVTAGDDNRTLGPRGISGDLDTLMFPLTHGILWYTGIESYALHTVYDADDLDEEVVSRETHRLRARLAGLDEEPTRPFRKLSDGEYRGTRALRADLAPARTDLGIHLAEE